MVIEWRLKIVDINDTVNTKNVTIDIVKGIAIILVVFGHLIQYSLMPSSEDFFTNPVFKIIYSFHMPLYIFISGYLIAFSLKRRNIYDTFKSRVRSLIIPYMMWVTIDVVFNLFKIIIKNQELSLIKFNKMLIKMFILSPDIWFLFTLFALCCILLISIGLEKKIGKISYAIIFILVVIFPTSAYFDIYFIKWFYLFFIVGYFSNRCSIIKAFYNQSKLIKSILPFVGLILFIVLISIWTKNDYIYNNQMRFITSKYFAEIIRLLYRYITAFLGIGIIFYIANLLTKSKVKNIFISFGTYSLDIFLLQRYIVEIFYSAFARHIYTKLDYNSPSFIFVYVPIATFLCLCLCIIISKYVLRKRKLINQLLLGNRG